MSFLIITIILLIISFFLSLFSIKDFSFGSKIIKILRQRTIKGTILFSKGKVIHYSSKLSSSVSKEESS